MKISKKGLDLIKHFEGLYLEAYICPGGVWTIGYGHTTLVNGRSIHKGMKITTQKAEQLLVEDLQRYEKAVNDNVRVALDQSKFDALVSFTFNLGIGAFKSSTLLRVLNAHNYREVPRQLLRWNKAKGKVLDGLIRRRMSEAWLFTMGEFLSDFNPQEPTEDFLRRLNSTLDAFIADVHYCAKSPVKSDTNPERGTVESPLFVENKISPILSEIIGSSLPTVSFEMNQIEPTIENIKSCLHSSANALNAAIELVKKMENKK